jgi:predicted esterase
VILWAGLLPPEIDPAGSWRERLASSDLHLVRGTRDAMLDAAKVEEQKDVLARAGIRSTVLEFDGGHRLDRETLEKLG